MTNITRRAFLEDSLFAAAAASLASQSLLRPKSLRAQDSSDILRVAVCGFNGRGGEHIQQFAARKDCEIAALIDVDEVVANKRADQLEEKTGKRPVIYADLRKALEDKSLNIISIATPNHWHALAAIWSIQAGKDVYVEKPVSHNVSEGRRIVEAARKHNKIVQTGTQSRSSVGLHQAVKFLRDGGLGEVKLARGLCYKNRPSIGPKGNYDVPASVNYDLWCGPAQMTNVTRPRFHYDWHWQWDYGNGDLGNQGIHQMDIARWALGEMDIGKSVRSYGGRFGYEDAGETANTQVSIHEFASGKRLVFEVRGLKTEKLDGAGVGVVVYGSKGKMVIPSYSSAVVYDNDGKEVQQFSGGGDHFGNFIDAVRKRDYKLLNADILEGHLSSALCHLGNISYRLGTPVSSTEVQKALGEDAEAQGTLDRFLQHLADNQVDPQTAKIGLGPKLALTDHETFTGEHADAANKMLTREYRAPFVVPKAEDL